MSPGYERIAERRFDDILLPLKRLNADTTRSDQFTNALVGLGMEIYHSVAEVQSGARERVLSRAALGTRNLLELRYWTMFAAASEANIVRLRKEALIDFREMLDKFAGACKATPELALALPYIEQGQQQFEELCRQSAESADGTSSRVSSIAQQLGYADEHRAMSAFLSKLIHPTGLSICLPSTRDFAFGQLYSVGCWYFNDSYERLNGVLKKLNLPVLE